jgi:hypothetical protein
MFGDTQRNLKSAHSSGVTQPLTSGELTEQITEPSAPANNPDVRGSTLDDTVPLIGAEVQRNAKASQSAIVLHDSLKPSGEGFSCAQEKLGNKNNANKNTSNNFL